MAGDTQQQGASAARLLRVGRFFGVPVYFAPSWVLIAALITVTYHGVVADTVAGISTTGSYAGALGFAVGLAGCVLAHELGHVAVSLALGQPVRRVVIFLLGGVSEIERDPPRPRDEFLVAVAGPLVSLVIAGAALSGRSFVADASLASVLLALIGWSNLIVAVFNLLPGLPLDGGRVMRAAVWRLSGSRVTGTRVASWAGRGVAVLVVLPGLVFPGQDWGLATALFGLALGAFIWFGATQALRAAVVQDRVPALDLSALVRLAVPVRADISTAEALRQAWESGARGVVVVDAQGRPRAIVGEDQIRAVPPQRQAWVPITDVARPLVEGMVLPLTLSGTALLEAVRRTPASEYLVVRPDGSPTGILSTADVMAALREPAR